MKNTILKQSISIVVFILPILMFSCEDFLDILPKSTVTVDYLFKTDKDYQDAMIGAYGVLHDVYDDYWEFGDLRGDDCIQSALRFTGQVEIDQFVPNVNAGRISNFWDDNYQIITQVNLILSKLGEADPASITNKELYTGEAKFLRALSYFNLVRIFGDVPMITTPVTSEEAMLIPRENVDRIYEDIIIPDFLEAESKLPASYSSGSDLGRATKGAAKSLLGKVYLTIHDFVKAETKLLEVTSMGYALLNNFEDLFDFDNEHHSEYIFDIEYLDGDIGLGSNFTRMFAGEFQDFGAVFRDALMELYGIQGRESGGLGTPSLDFLSLFEPGDLRQYRTASTGIYDINGNWVEIPDGSQIKAICQKYGDAVVTDCRVNWRVTRYADVLLMLAEAMNENGKTDEALTYLNQIRARAGLEGYTGLTQDEARDKILAERRFELYLEGHRWFDLVRTGNAMEFCEPFGMEAFMTIFPVPQRQVEVINDPAIFPQNPGY
jgi:hypothetical protein